MTHDETQVLHEELKPLNQRRQVLVRMLDRKEIPETEFTQEYSVATIEQQRIVERLNQLQTDKYRKQNELDNRRREIMADEVKKAKAVKEPKVSKPRGPKKDSYASVILEALQMKSVKSIDSCADKVLERKPGRDKGKLKAQISVMINEVKKGKKPAYTWDDESFQLTHV